MSVKYFTQVNQPVYKNFFGDATATTVAIWTPASTKSIVLTDILFSTSAAGTVRFGIGVADLTIARTNLFEFITAGSAVVSINLDSPILGTADQVISVVTGMNGRTCFTLAGFEQD